MIAAMNEDVIHANHIVFAQIAHFAETHIFVLVSPRTQPPLGSGSGSGSGRVVQH